MTYCCLTECINDNGKWTFGVFMEVRVSTGLRKSVFECCWAFRVVSIQLWDAMWPFLIVNCSAKGGHTAEQQIAWHSFGSTAVNNNVFNSVLLSANDPREYSLFICLNPLKYQMYSKALFSSCRPCRAISSPCALVGPMS